MLREFVEEKKDSKINVIAITERNPNGSGHLYPSAKKVKEECEKRDIPFYPILVPGSSYVSDYDQDNSNIVIRNLKEPDIKIELDPKDTVVIVRGSVINDQNISSFFTYLESKGAFIINNKSVIDLCANKFNTTIKLKVDGIPVPKTALISKVEEIDGILDQIGNNFPVIIKTLRGSSGIGVSRVDSKESLVGVLQSLWKHRAKICLQEYLDSDYDVRTIVLDGQIITSMKRHRISGDFRSNFSLGGNVESYELSRLEKEIVLKSAKSIGAFFCGVDHMVVDSHPYVIEVNSSPGSKGIQKATGINVISVLMDYIIDKSNWQPSVYEIGFMEKIIFPEIHNMKLDAKADTGNGMYNVLHAEEMKIIDDIISFKVFGNKIVKKIKEVIEVKKGGLQDYEENRVLVNFDVIFNGKQYNDIPFTLDDRSDRSPVLLCRNFLCELGVNVNPNLKFNLGENIDFKQFRKMFL